MAEGIIKLLGFISILFVAAKIILHLSRSVVGDNPFHLSLQGTRLRLRRIRALFRYLYHEDFAILIITLGFVTLLISKYFGLSPGLDQNFWIELITLFPVLYCVMIYAVEGMGLEPYLEGEESED